MTKRIHRRTQPRPKAVEPLAPELRAELQRRIDASSARAVERETSVSCATLARAARGEGVTPIVRRYLGMLLTRPSTQPAVASAAA